MQLIIYTDGGSRGNPGQAGIGYVIKNQEGEILLKKGKKIGIATNNEAEYWGIITALKEASLLDNASQSSVIAFLDSKLVVEQLSGRWRVKEPRLARLAQQAKTLERNFARVSYRHIPRGKNALADALLNKALDA